MRIVKREIAFAWPGPLEPPRDLPAGPYYEPVLTFAHGASHAGDEVRDALGALAGPGRRWVAPWLGAFLSWSGPKWPLRARVRGDHAEVRVGHRLSTPAVRKLVGALAVVPDARDLRLEAKVAKSESDFAHIRACTPCQAARMRVR